MSPTTLFAIVGLIIIIILAAYAWNLVKQVKQAEADVERQQQEEAAKAAHNLRQKQLELVNDIRFVARSVLEQQCEITEGVLRIHYLISGLDPDAWQLPELTQLRKHYESTRSMPILDEYKKLNKKQQFKLDTERWTRESDNKEAIEKDLRWLVTYSFPQVTLLQ